MQSPTFQNIFSTFLQGILNSITSIILVKWLNNRKIKLKVVAAVTPINFCL